MAAIWSEKVQVHVGADAGAPTLGLLSGTADFLRMNTDLVWANRPFIILANNDLIKGVISPYAGLYKIVSDASLVEWGGYSANDALVAYSRADVAGEPTENNIFLETASDAGLYSGAATLSTRAVSTGVAGQFLSVVDVTSKNATNNCQVEAIANSTAGASLLVTLNGAADSEINLQATVTTGLSVDLTGFKAQTFDHAFRINDEDGVVTKFSPFVSDGTTAVAYLFDTSNTLQDLTPRIAAFRNNGIDELSISPFGGLFRFVSNDTLTLWGPYTTGDALVSLSRADVVGEPDSHIIMLAATSDDWSFDGSVFIDANAASTGGLGNYNAQVNVSANNSTITTQVLNRVSTAEGAWTDIVGFAAQTNAFNFRISDEGGVVTKFSPFVADGATAVAYTFDTSNALADNNSQLLSIRNNGVTYLGISRLGGLTIGPNTAAWNSEQAIAGIIMHRDVALGEDDEATITLDVTDGAANGSATLTASSTVSTLFLSLPPSAQIVFECDASPSISLDIVTVKTFLNPGVADGATAVAYLFDTANLLANAGARIVSFENQGTRKASIDKDGFYYVSTNKVVGARVIDARIDDTPNSGDATTDGIIDAIQDALIAHGLAAAA